MSNSVMKCASFTLAKVSLAVCLYANSYADDFNKELIRKECPGYANWETQHRESNKRNENRIDVASDGVLRAKLLKMVRRDQSVRNSLDPLGPQDKVLAVIQHMNRVDTKNLNELRRIVAQHGVPTPSEIGQDGVDAFWLLIQHADIDPQLQESVLRTISSGGYNISLEQIALLTDRIRINHKQPQIYGTQFHVEADRIVQDPVENVEKLAELRGQMNLMPNEIYKCYLSVGIADVSRKAGHLDQTKPTDAQP